jgi:dTDP-4-dehydrorhamnose 3,5-epimerase-like enzyme
MPLRDCRIIELQKRHDFRGNLTVVEGEIDIPFEISRIYYLYDVPENSDRGMHGHKNLRQLIIAMSGSFDVFLDDGCKNERIHLNRSNYGLYVHSMMWRSIENFSSNAVCLVLASERYDETDYIHDYDTFVSIARDLSE